MSKVGIGILLSILLVFGIIFYSSQSNVAIKTEGLKTDPLPSGSEVFKPINYGQSQEPQQQAQMQQQAAQQQAQQQQEVQAATDIQGPLNASVSATIKTSKGTIKLTLFAKDAPNTVRNFMSKAKSGYYKNLTFHRVEDWVIQGGDPKGDGTGGGQMKTETTTQPFVVGSLGVARGSDPQISNDSQFFITKTAADWLNGQYTNFGIVTEGMDVVNKMKIGDKILSISVDQ